MNNLYFLPHLTEGSPWQGNTWLVWVCGRVAVGPGGPHSTRVDSSQAEEEEILLEGKEKLPCVSRKLAISGGPTKCGPSSTCWWFSLCVCSYVHLTHMLVNLALISSRFHWLLGRPCSTTASTELTGEGRTETRSQGEGESL